MSGIYGFKASGFCGDPQHVLTKMRKALPAFESTLNSEWSATQKHVGLGVIHPKRICMPSHYAEDSLRGVYCIFDGILHEPSGSNKNSTNELSGAETLLKEYVDNGPDCIQKYSGSFNVAWWDGKNERLVLATDKLGQRLLFYSQQNGAFVFASYLARIMASGIPSKEIDLEGLVDLINFAYILGERTLFKSVRTLPPAGILIYKNGQIRIRQYFHLHQIEPRGSYGRARLDELSELFKIAVRRSIRTPIKTAIDLTGGLDSRCILAAAAHMQLPFITHTGGQIDSTDVILARKAAAITRSDHFFEILTPDKIADWLRPMVLFQGGVVSSLHSHPCQHFELPMPFDAVVQGIGISYIRGQWVALSDLAGSNPQKLRQRLMHLLLSGTALKVNLEKLWKPEVRQYGLQKAQEHLDEVFQQYFVPSRAGDILDHVAWVERCRKFLNKAIFIVRGVREAYFPFLDDEFMIALARIPKVERVSIKIQKDLIKRFCPELLDVPWEKTLIPLSTSPAKSWLIKKSWAAQRRLSRLTGIADNTPKKKANHNLAQWCRMEMRASLKDLLYNAKAAFRDYFDWQSVKPLLDEHFSGQNNWEHLLAVLTVFEIANELWVDSQRNYKQLD